MKRKTILRVLSCFLAGVLLIEAPIQVDAAQPGSLEEPALSADADEGAGEEKTLDENGAEQAGTMQEPEEEGQKDVSEKPAVQEKQQTASEASSEIFVKASGEKESGKEFLDPVPAGDEGASGDQGAEQQPVEDPDAEPAEEEPVTLQTADLILTGLQYGSLPQYSENFDADAVSVLLADLSDSLADGQADVSEYAVSPETLADALTWLAGHDEAYYTLLPYAEYTYIEREEHPEVQTVTVAQLPEEDLLTVSAVRDAEDVKISFAPADGIEQYRLFRITADEIAELSMEEGQELFLDKTVFEEQSDCRYVLCGYQTVEEDLRLCAFSQCITGEYELTPPENLETASGEGSITLTWDAVELASGYEIEEAEQEDGEFIPLGQVEGTEYIQDQLGDGEEHFYRVRAYSDVDAEVVYSDASVVASGVTLPGTPVLDEPHMEEDQISFTWEAVSGDVDGYILYELKDTQYVPLKRFDGNSGTNYSTKIPVDKPDNKIHQYVLAVFTGTVGTDNTYNKDNMKVSDPVELKIVFGAVDLYKPTVNYNQVKLYAGTLIRH